MRGLKLAFGVAILLVGASHPAWDAWIEISTYVVVFGISKSHPAWDAWIEIVHVKMTVSGGGVASRMGCVD